MTSTSHASTWPGEWNPARNDVALASEVPDSTMLSEFKRALLMSEEARSAQHLMHLDLSTKKPRNEYTYPLSILTELPSIPEYFELGRLRQDFTKQRANVAFLDAIPIASESRETIPPHLLLSMASFASVFEKDANRSRDLFLAAIGLWDVMSEIDNRETRTDEALIAGVLLSVYGAVDSDPRVWRWTRIVLYGVATIARRRRLHDCSLLDHKSIQRLHGPTICALWLADLLQAVHMDSSLNFSTQEIDIVMPNSSSRLQDCLARLLKRDSKKSDPSHSEDAMILLMALLSDSIYLQRSLSRVAAPDPVNPFVPLSPHSEHERMHGILSSGFDNWLDAYHRTTPEILVFYHYCRFYLWYPQVSSLASHACYPSGQEVTEPKATISNTAITHAWAILDNVAAADSKLGMDKTIEPLWFPVATFHAGLAIWAQNCGSKPVHSSSTRILLPFIVELQKMSWPCVAKMASCLEDLMAPDRKR